MSDTPHWAICDICKRDKAIVCRICDVDSERVDAFVELERVEAERDRLRAAALAYQSLCAHLRIGKTPSEKLFRELADARAALAESEGSTHQEDG